MLPGRIGEHDRAEIDRTRLGQQKPGIALGMQRTQLADTRGIERVVGEVLNLAHQYVARQADVEALRIDRFAWNQAKRRAREVAAEILEKAVNIAVSLELRPPDTLHHPIHLCPL